MKPSPSTLRNSLLGVLLVASGLTLAAAFTPTGPPSASQEDARPPAGLLYPRTIVVLRHAEKAAAAERDPSLSEAGALRADALARLLGHAGVTHLFASEYKRTQQTLLPLARAVGTEVQIVPAQDPRALLSSLDSLPRDSLAVVAGHSNTVPGLVAALAPGALVVRRNPDALKLAEGDYDRVFIVTQWAPDKGAEVLELRY